MYRGTRQRRRDPSSDVKFDGRANVRTGVIGEVNGRYSRVAGVVVTVGAGVPAKQVLAPVTERTSTCATEDKETSPANGPKASAPGVEEALRSENCP